MALFFRLLLLLLPLMAVLQAQPKPNTQPLTIRWYGQGFVYIITSEGDRIAMDPYGETVVDYKFPLRLQADVILISNEADESSAAYRLQGSPQTYRSASALGLNKARGFLFKGVETYCDNKEGDQLGENTVFCFELDGIRFAHLGAIGHPLSPEQRRQIGGVDVLFLPVGNPSVSIADMKKFVVDLDAKIVLPISYATLYNTRLPLRKLDEFLNGATDVQRLESNEFTVSSNTLPATPKIYVLKATP